MSFKKAESKIDKKWQPLCHSPYCVYAVWYGSVSGTLNEKIYEDLCSCVCFYHIRASHANVSIYIQLEN